MLQERTFSLLLLSCPQFSTTPMGRPPRKSVPEVFPFLIQAPSKFLTRLQFMRIFSACGMKVSPPTAHTLYGVGSIINARGMSNAPFTKLEN